MKSILVIFFLLFHGLQLSAQNCSSYQSTPFIDLDSNFYPSHGHELSKLDSLYPAAILSLPDTGVFINHGRFGNAWSLFEKDLGQFLFDRGFVWKENTWCLHKVYFNKYGKIDHFLFKFKEDDLAYVQLSLFVELLFEFKDQYKFFVVPKSNFSYCSHVTYAKTNQ